MGSEDTVNIRQQYKRAYALMRDDVHPDDHNDWEMALAEYPKFIQDAARSSCYHRHDGKDALTPKQYRRVLNRLDEAGLGHLKKHVYPKAFPDSM